MLSINQPANYNTNDKTTDGSRKDYTNLRNNYGIEDSSVGFNIIISSPLYFVRPAAASNGSIGIMNSQGNYWTYGGGNTRGTARFLRVTETVVQTNSMGRTTGAPLRCVSK